MVIILMVVSGSGKTKIGNLLSKQTGIPFFDGDDFHPDANVRKMAEGIPLTNQDRVEWIAQIAGFMNGSPDKYKILACSALNKYIRALIIKEIKEPCYFVFLKGDFDLIKEKYPKAYWAHQSKRYFDSNYFLNREETLSFIIDDYLVEAFWVQDDNYYQYARLTEPDGTIWTGWSGYGVGAGLEDGDHGYSTSKRESLMIEHWKTYETNNAYTFRSKY